MKPNNQPHPDGQSPQPDPPRWANALLERFCPEQSREEVQGDLAELYAHWLQAYGKREADRRYAFNALRLLQPFGQLRLFGKRKKPSSLPADSPLPTPQLAPIPICSNIPIHSLAIDTVMLGSYLKIGLRNLVKNKVYS
ncbi:permease prefix domain 2-containing transporter, partial [Cytophagaceae bacterium YF14B1]